MNGTVISILVFFLLMWGCVTCNTKSNTSRAATGTDTTINVLSTASDGLDLKALGAVVKTVKNAEELEKKLNEAGGINNMDLNDDGKADYIKVSEYGNDTDEFGFSLTIEPVEGEVQEIATIEIFKEETEAKVQVNGNQQVYGPGQNFGFVSTVGSMLLLGYLLVPTSDFPLGYLWVLNLD